MNEFRILLVDDEPLAVEAIATLLESVDDYAFDLYRAYSAREALQILDEGRMDLVISDIEMSGVSGIELLEEINRRWTDCPVAFLTAHSNFNYAYRAFQNTAANYILKTESDETIKREILKILDKISLNARLTPDELVSDKSTKSENEHALGILRAKNTNEVFRRLKSLRFPTDSPSYFMVLCGYSGEKKLSQALRELFRYHLQKRFPYLLSAITEENDLVWLIQRQPDDERDALTLFGLLETVQRSCEATFRVPTAIVMNAFSMNDTLPSAIYSKALETREHIRNSRESVLYSEVSQSSAGAGVSSAIDGAGNTVAWICNYIQTHINDDVSLLKLSTLTGYNAQYLSGIFHQVKGQTISRYIAEHRIKAVRRLLEDKDIPIQEASRRLGFSSRSYFNRFVKQETGMTPQQLRAKLLNEQEHDAR